MEANDGGERSSAMADLILSVCPAGTERSTGGLDFIEN